MPPNIDILAPPTNAPFQVSPMSQSPNHSTQSATSPSNAMNHLDFLGLTDPSINQSIMKLIKRSNGELTERILFSSLVTKINRKQKEQSRALIITTRAIYNMLPSVGANSQPAKQSIKQSISTINPLASKQVKRRIPIISLSSISLSQSSDEFVLHVPDEYDYRFKSPHKDKIAELIARLIKRLNQANNAPNGTQSAVIVPVPSQSSSPSQSSASIKYKFHVEYVNDTDLSSITLTKQQARLQSREDILRRKKDLMDEQSVYQGINPVAQITQGLTQINVGPAYQGQPINPNHEIDQSVAVTGLVQGSEKVQLSDFELLKVLGRGSFGKVMLVRYRPASQSADASNGALNHQKYAMKVLKKKDIVKRNQVDHTMSERKILALLQHPYLVKLRFAFQSDVKLYFVLDYYAGGELFFHLKQQRRFPESVARLFVAEIALALGHLHELGVVYRDLKPENILLDEQGHVCLTDFGLSKDLEPADKSYTFCGTPEYLAPEVVAGLGHNQAVDWWSLGILLYELSVGIPPFYSTNVNEMYNKIQHDELRFPPFLSRECADVITGLLQRDPSRRLGSSERDVQEIQEMPFFSSIDWKALYERKIESPYRPYCQSTSEAANFDAAFTNEAPVDSFVQQSTLQGSPQFSQNKDVFNDFSYIPKKGEEHNEGLFLLQ